MVAVDRPRRTARAPNASASSTSHWTGTRLAPTWHGGDQGAVGEAAPHLPAQPPWLQSGGPRPVGREDVDDRVPLGEREEVRQVVGVEHAYAVPRGQHEPDSSGSARTGSASRCTVVDAGSAATSQAWSAPGRARVVCALPPAYASTRSPSTRTLAGSSGEPAASTTVRPSSSRRTGPDATTSNALWPSGRSGDHASAPARRPVSSAAGAHRDAAVGHRDLAGEGQRSGPPRSGDLGVGPGGLARPAPGEDPAVGHQELGRVPRRPGVEHSPVAGLEPEPGTVLDQVPDEPAAPLQHVAVRPPVPQGQHQHPAGRRSGPGWGTPRSARARRRRRPRRRR